MYICIVLAIWYIWNYKHIYIVYVYWQGQFIIQIQDFIRKIKGYEIRNLDYDDKNNSIGLHCSQHVLEIDINKAMRTIIFPFPSTSWGLPVDIIHLDQYVRCRLKTNQQILDDYWQGRTMSTRYNWKRSRLCTLGHIPVSYQSNDIDLINGET